MFENKKTLIVPAIIMVCLGCLVLFLLPPVRARLDAWTAEVRYRLNPPEEIVFVPDSQIGEIDLAVTLTLAAMMPSATGTATPEATATPAGPTLTPTISPTPTQTPTALPASVSISGMEYQDQHGLWNYCGPANLAMATTFWGVRRTRIQTGAFLRGAEDRFDDKNVMPYEMENYITQETNLNVVVRMGGNIDLLKSLIAAGFPVIVEKDDIIENVGWLGHYLMLTGYNDAKREFISMDTYHGAGTPYDYTKLENSWRAFNYTFLVVYPAEQEAALFKILGPYTNDEWATQHALSYALEESSTQSGLAEFYAWFNVGSSYVRQFDYSTAAVAYDTAWAIYAQLPAEERPWRIMWYQTGPYFAYYYTGRYQDVVNLVNSVFEASETANIIEESFYWRGLAYEGLGLREQAMLDLTKSVTLNPNFTPGWEQLTRMQNGQ